MPKFFVRQDQIKENEITILGDDAFHISRALRMAKGERIDVSDMQGNQYECILKEFNPDNVVATVVSRVHLDNEPPVKVYLYQALPKGDKLDTVIQKSVECGVYEITPFESDRCVVKAKAEAEDRKTERRNRISLEAAKQCGRGYVPIVNKTVSFDEAVTSALKCDLALLCYEGEETVSIRSVLSDAVSKGISSVSIMIGSEGGFSTPECDRAKAGGMVSVGLGKRILRTETAASFVLSCIAYETEL